MLKKTPKKKNRAHVHTSLGVCYHFLFSLGDLFAHFLNEQGCNQKLQLYEIMRERELCDMELAKECLYVGLNPHAMWHSMRQVSYVCNFVIHKSMNECGRFIPLSLSPEENRTQFPIPLDT